MQAGECWIFDSWRRHQVVNGGGATRVHLVIDTCGSSRFWRMVREAEAQPPTAIATAAKLLPFQPGQQAIIRTERFSNLPVMAPGECEALIEDLIADFSANSNNDAQLLDEYAALLRGFAQDWRELWLLHGHRPGRPPPLPSPNPGHPAGNCIPTAAL